MHDNLSYMREYIFERFMRKNIKQRCIIHILSSIDATLEREQRTIVQLIHTFAF